MPRPAFVGTPTSATGTAGGGGGPTITLDTPAGAAVGETLLAVLTLQPANDTDWDPPSGWTRIGPAHLNDNAVRTQTFFILPLSTAPANSYQFTRPGPGGRIHGFMVRVQNLDTNDPVVDTSGPTGLLVTGNTISSDPIDSTEADCLMVLGYMSNYASPASDVTLSSGPDGMTEAYYGYTGDVGGAKTPVGVYTQDVDIESVAAKTIITNADCAQRAVRILILRGGDPVEADTKTIQVYNGSSTEEAKAWWYNGADLVSISDILALPHGERFTIADMLNEDPFYWAHRGGSANFLEFTMRAFTNSVWHGAKCLEISLQRSSDGVWVMHHDATTTRMTGQNHTIASTSWATLSGLTQSGNGFTGPIERFDDFLQSDYARSLVIVVEDKTYANTAALLDLIESYFPRAEAVQRFIIKSYGGGGTSHTTEPINRGYVQWGYFYDTDSPGSVPAKMALYDILGLNHDADQTHWDDMLATGKRVVGHIINNSTQANNALSKGASGLQVGNVLSVVPRLNTLPGM